VSNHKFYISSQFFLIARGLILIIDNYCFWIAHPLRKSWKTIYYSFIIYLY